MIKETSLCMGCMNDKTYDGPCKLCGYSDNTPNIPTYLAPKTFLADRYIVGKVISYNGEGAVYIGYDTAAGAKVTIKEFMADTLCSRRKGETDITVDPVRGGALQDLPVGIHRPQPHADEAARNVPRSDRPRRVLREQHCLRGIRVHQRNFPQDIPCELLRGDNLGAGERAFLTVLHNAEPYPFRGIIHRGISPSTIFVTDKLELKLTGFAICAARTTGTEIPCEMFAGFAAPEQYTNEINGTWTDVYGISAVLYRA